MTGKITERQWSFLVQLVEQKDLSSLSFTQAEYLSKEPKEFWKMSKEQASNAISILVKLPRKPVLAVVDSEPQVANVTNEQTAQGAQVDQGRYFIVDPTDGVEKFFKVDKPKDGRWKGYTFLHVQASDFFYPIKDRRHREAVLAEIAKDPIAAMNEYGIRLGLCGRCGRTLTARSSRLRGIGPICADILDGTYTGDDTDEDDDAMLRQLGLIE